MVHLLTAIMSEIFVFISVAIIFGFIGIYIGAQFSKLKQQSETSKTEADLKNSKNQYLQLQEQNKKTLQERELLRDEKDTIREELTRKTTEFKNLEQKLAEQKEDVKKLQETTSNIRTTFK